MIRSSISVFANDLSPAELSHLLELSFDAAWAAGDLYPGQGVLANRRRKNNCWRISCESIDEDVADSVGATAEKILRRTEGHDAQFRKAVSLGCRVEFSIYSIGPSTPTVCLEPSLLARITDLGASLDVDIVISA